MEQADIPVFSSRLNIPYDTRFIPGAQAHVRGLAVLAGADGREVVALALLVEECLSFIIGKYMDSRFDAHIELCFSLDRDGGVSLDMTDLGPPVHPGARPDFCAPDTVTEVWGWSHLMRSLADDFEFLNRGSEGWLIRVRKSLKSPSFERDEGGGAGRAAVPAGGGFRTRWAGAGDAPALVDLAYMTYRYSYEPTYYDVSGLARRLRDGRLSFLVVEQGARIVGGVAIKYPAEPGGPGEVGSAMILPEFRNAASVVRRLFVDMSRHLVENPRGCAFFFSAAVTSHDRSQRLLDKLGGGFRPLAVFPRMVPGPSFVGIADAVAARENLMLTYLFRRPVSAARIFAPAMHCGIIRDLLDNAGCAEVAVSARTAPPDASGTSIRTLRAGSAGFAVLDLVALGPDWSLKVSRELLSLVTSGIANICVNVSATRPLPADLDAVLKTLGLTFCGLAVLAPEALALAYCLAVTASDLARMRLCDPVMLRLAEHIERHLAPSFGPDGAPDPGEPDDETPQPFGEYA